MDQIVQTALVHHVRAAGELGVQDVLESEERVVVEEREQVALGVLQLARVEELLH